MIVAKDLVKVYSSTNGKVSAVNGVSLEVMKGEMVGIAGESGCGKSTLLNLLSTLDDPTSGKVYYYGDEVTGYTDAQKCKLRMEKIGFIFQQFNLEPSLSVISNVTIIPMLRGEGKTSRNKRGLEILEQLGLSDKAKVRASELSGGEMQRVAFARAVINNPDVIFADEPTGNLDSKNSAMIIEMLRNIAKNNVAVVLVTHNNEDVSTCDKVIRLLDGKVIGGE